MFIIIINFLALYYHLEKLKINVSEVLDALDDECFFPGSDEEFRWTDDDLDDENVT